MATPVIGGNSAETWAALVKLFYGVQESTASHHGVPATPLSPPPLLADLTQDLQRSSARERAQQWVEQPAPRPTLIFQAGQMLTAQSLNNAFGDLRDQINELKSKS